MLFCSEFWCLLQPSQHLPLDFLLLSCLYMETTTKQRYRRVKRKRVAERESRIQ